VGATRGEGGRCGRARVWFHRTLTHVQHEKEHALDFTFDWKDDHFAGHFIDNDGNRSQAVVALWTGLDAIRFGAA
jgi:hypothetical protein